MDHWYWKDLDHRAEIDRESSSSIDPDKIPARITEEEDKMETEKTHVLMLSSSNYQRWSFEMQAILESKDCLEIVNGDETIPDQTTDPAEYKSWKKRDATARMVISKSLDDQHHTFIRDCKTSKEMWERIQSVKDQSNVSNKLLINQDFHSYRWESGSSVASSWLD